MYPPRFYTESGVLLHYAVDKHAFPTTCMVNMDISRKLGLPCWHEIVSVVLAAVQHVKCLSEVFSWCESIYQSLLFPVHKGIIAEKVNARYKQICKRNIIILITSLLRERVLKVIFNVCSTFLCRSKNII